MVKIGDYCKYCGSSDLEKVKYEAKGTNSTKTSKYIGVSHIIKAGVDNSSEGKIENTLYRDTYLCRKCKKIECLCNIEPIKINIFGISSYTIIIPYTFQALLESFRVNKIKLIELIYDLINQRGLKKNIKDFYKYGKNRCNNSELGYNRKIKIYKQDISIHILMEIGMENAIVLRLVYDGGKSIC
ncbi:hypothetical protein [Ferroplasma acidiphilum]|uniref:hypothetical protein n=1 Tax=Ferroplasma acidiphilum TaxID=74969 RepID=UPI0028158832|nr:hypothetical protein [Ferroplasma acidiphilum]WMT53533.1 MAG: hypothetical protein RE473_01470 [Ferroplasma acidiphilum]